MSTFIDQTGRTITLEKTPARIISLVPSQTELLFYLGLDKEVIGITRFCVHPEQWFRTKTRIGGTKQINTALIHQLHPDLIIANKEENIKEQVEELATRYPVWVSDINNLKDAYEMIHSIANMVGKTVEGTELNAKIQFEFDQLKTIDNKIRTAYLIWKEPYMTVGGDTFIHSMLAAAGLENIFANRIRYPEINVEELKAIHPELVLLSSEPYPFQQKHIDELQSALPQTKIILADGEMFSWYGSRLEKAPAYFSKLRNQLN